MKVNKAIIRTLIVMIVAILGIGLVMPSLAVTNENKELVLEHFRYINGNPTNGYQIQVAQGDSMQTLDRHPVFQIMSTDKNNNQKSVYYCLNALYGSAWNRAVNEKASINNPAKYTQYYNLNSESDIEQLKHSTNDVYKNIANNSENLSKIVWILDNAYISGSTNDDVEQKRSLLAKAGIVYENYAEGSDIKAYRYKAQNGYNYTSKIIETDAASEGWLYTDNDGNYISVELTDDLIEVSQQLALWYYTNCLDNNSSNSTAFDFKQRRAELYKGIYNVDDPKSNWKHMEDYVYENQNGRTYHIGSWLEDQATILTSYLIDAANNYATQANDVTGNPLSIQPQPVAELKENNAGYYIVGPITINEKRPAVYTLNNTLTVKSGNDNNTNNEVTGSYISDSNGNKSSNQTIANYVGKAFYVAVPKSEVKGTSIKIAFDGSYKNNNKKLWINEGAGEQPIVEVTPENKKFTLEVNAKVPEQPKEFDLALRKAITKITSANGKTKLVINENGVNAERKVTVDTSTIPNTATYKHRKDPVVVEKGDIVTYSITVYNEGEMDGYAKTIVDKLPQGLALKGFNVDKTTTGTYKNGNITYSYVYDKDNNTITFTNVSKNVLSKFEGTLASETIEIECEVIGEPSTTTNTYLTNIAYISGAHNTETNLDVVQDRDSSTNNNPQANQNTTGDKYEGYHGGNNNNGDNTKNVYNDGTNNDDYFPGREDDDDFEIVVIKPAVFDMALRKYITNVISPEGTMKPGKNAPTIDTTKLANGTATTADYQLDKTLIKVKSGDYVLYTFNVYNEGQIDGYVKKITDNIPTGLEFVYPKEPQDGKTVIRWDSKGKMTEYEVSSSEYQRIISYNEYWSIDTTDNELNTDTYNGESTISITCDVENAIPIAEGGLGTPIGGGFLKAYDSSKDNNNDGSGLDRLSVQVLLRVSAQNGSGVTIRNEAAITEATDKNGNKQDVTDLKDRDSQTDKWPGKDGDKNYQDDEDYDNIILGKVDLALTKFITAISDDIKFEDGEYLTKDTTSKNAGSTSNPYTRQTSVDTTPLKNGGHDAIYTQVKTPLTIPERSYVLYNIRVYNEGDVDVYAGEVKDYLPNYLDYVDCEENRNLGWSVAADGKTVTTNYLSKVNGEDKILKAYDKVADDGKGSKLDYKDLPILCRINTNAPDKTKLINSAEITKYEDEDGEEIDKDIDSEPDNLTEKNTEKREQDDDDYEVVEVKKKKVDLALSKFIAAISNDTEIIEGEYLTANGNVGSKENPYTRATEVDTTQLRDDENCHDATYTKVKDPLVVPAQSYVLYDIRVYNEGETDVYAGEVTDHLPDYLDYVDCDFNKNFGWSVASDGKTVSTTYLSYSNGEKNLLKAFDKKTDDGKGSGLDYRDLQVLCRVNENAPTNTNIVNVAEITKYENEHGDSIPDDDIDSKPNNVDEKHEDDDDYETVLIKTFDLSLLKYVSEVYVTEDGKTTTTQTGNTGDDSKDIIPKVEINKKKLSSTVVKFGYTIKITNEGDIEGYAKEITDYVPEGLKFYAEDNNGWTDEGNDVISTRLLENTLLKPGESAEVKVIFRWINGSNNLGLKTNTAEISEDYNKEGIPDRDSTPDNKKVGEDDIDDAKVILSIKTGLVHNIVMYSTIGLIVLVIMGTGIYGIKKYVL